jgi:hypothetical protein
MVLLWYCVIRHPQAFWSNRFCSNSVQRALTGDFSWWVQDGWFPRVLGECGDGGGVQTSCPKPSFRRHPLNSNPTTHASLLKVEVYATFGNQLMIPPSFPSELLSSGAHTREEASHLYDNAAFRSLHRTVCIVMVTWIIEYFYKSHCLF